MKIKVVIIGIALFLVGFYVWKTDTFQRKFFPKNYWQNQVQSSKSNIKSVRCLIREAMIELIKLQSTAKLEVAQEVNLARSIDMDPDEARRRAVEKIRDQIKVLRDEILMLRELLSEEKKRLEQAKEELSKYK